MWKLASVSIVLTFLNFVNSANILGVFPFPSISHQIVYQPIWRELSLRGHQVTVITPNPLNDSFLTNLTEIDVGFSYEFLKIHRIDQLFSKDINKYRFITNIYQLLDIILMSQLEDVQVKNLIMDEDQKFDLIIFEYFYPVLLGLGSRFSAPIIGISSFGIGITGYDSVGNPTHPVLNPDFMLVNPVSDTDMSLLEKMQSCFNSLWLRIYYYYCYLPRADEMAKKYFGNDIPYIGDLANNISMLFLNVNPFLYTVRPNVPAIVELGQMHIKPIKPIPSDLQEILDEASAGVVYFSLGSNVKSTDLPDKLKSIIIEALSELPYKVLWKWESDYLPGKPDNVVIRKWLPQQDILAHPHIKVFVTQGGLQSSEEAIFRGVPLVGMPFIGDQPMNVQKLVSLGVAISVDPAIVSKEELKSAIIEVAENCSYRNKIAELSELMQDQPMTGLEKAVWWSEYVIRHKGARHLRSPAVDLPWYYYCLLDVIAAFVFIPLMLIYVIYKFVAYKKAQKFATKIKFC